MTLSFSPPLSGVEHVVHWTPWMDGQRPTSSYVRCRRIFMMMALTLDFLVCSVWGLPFQSYESKPVASNTSVAFRDEIFQPPSLSSQFKDWRQNNNDYGCSFHSKGHAQRTLHHLTAAEQRGTTHNRHHLHTLRYSEKSRVVAIEIETARKKSKEFSQHREATDRRMFNNVVANTLSLDHLKSHSNFNNHNTLVQTFGGAMTNVNQRLLSG